MRTPNPDHVARLIEVVNRAPYLRLISMRLETIGAGWSRFAVDLGEEHLQPFGLVHGGVIASIIDTAASWAVFYGIEEQDVGFTSVDLKLNYLAPAVPSVAERLLASGRQIKLGRTLGYAEAQVTDAAGKVLAHGTTTVMVLPGRAPAADPPFPAKFQD